MRSPSPSPSPSPQPPEPPLPALDVLAASTAPSQSQLPADAAEAALFLARAFRAGVPLRPALDATAKRHGTRAWDSAAAQDAVLAHTLGLERALRARVANFAYGAARSARFTRLLLAEVEEARAPLSEGLALAAATACAAAPRAAHAAPPGPAMCHITYAVPRAPADAAHGPDIVLRVAQHFSSLGRRVWTAGLVLHALASDGTSAVGRALRGLRDAAAAGRRSVLELGAGTGVCAGALSRAVGGTGAEVVLTDTADIVENLAYNARLNCGPAHAVRVETLDLTDAGAVVCAARAWGVGVAVASDVTYDEALVDGVVASMAALAGAGVTSFLVTMSRTAETDIRLADALQGCGARVRPLEVRLPAGAFDYVVDADLDGVRAFEIC